MAAILCRPQCVNTESGTGMVAAGTVLSPYLSWIVTWICFAITIEIHNEPESNKASLSCVNLQIIDYYQKWLHTLSDALKFIAYTKTWETVECQ